MRSNRFTERDVEDVLAGRRPSGRVRGDEIDDLVAVLHASREVEPPPPMSAELRAAVRAASLEASSIRATEGGAVSPDRPAAVAVDAIAGPGPGPAADERAAAAAGDAVWSGGVLALVRTPEGDPGAGASDPVVGRPCRLTASARRPVLSVAAAAAVLVGVVVAAGGHDRLHETVAGVGDAVGVSMHAPEELGGAAPRSTVPPGDETGAATLSLPPPPSPAAVAVPAPPADPGDPAGPAASAGPSEPSVTTPDGSAPMSLSTAVPPTAAATTSTMDGPPSAGRDDHRNGDEDRDGDADGRGGAPGDPGDDIRSAETDRTLDSAPAPATTVPPATATPPTTSPSTTVPPTAPPGTGGGAESEPDGRPAPVVRPVRSPAPTTVAPHRLWDDDGATGSLGPGTHARTIRPAPPTPGP